MTEEFEAGDPGSPTWSGLYRGPPEVPVRDLLNMKKTQRTGTATTTADDTQGAGGVTIETTMGRKLATDGTGITLGLGSSRVQPTPASVSITDGAPEVT